MSMESSRLKSSCRIPSNIDCSVQERINSRGAADGLKGEAPTERTKMAKLYDSPDFGAISPRADNEKPSAHE